MRKQSRTSHAFRREVVELEAKMHRAIRNLLHGAPRHDYHYEITPPTINALLSMLRVYWTVRFTYDDRTTEHVIEHSENVSDTLTQKLIERMGS